MNIITNDILDKFLKLGKEIKSAYIYIIGNNVYGVDESFIYLKHTTFENTYNIDMAFNLNAMGTFIKNISLNQIKLVNPNLLYSSFDNTIEINNPELINRILTMVNNINNLLVSNNKTIERIPVRGESNFEYALESKAADGTSIFIYNKYVMTIFKNLLPLKKSDKVFLSIIDSKSATFLSNFTIERSKTKIEVYIMYLHL